MCVVCISIVVHWWGRLGVGVVVEEGIVIVEMRLVRDSRRDAMDGGGLHEIGPVGEFIESVLGVGRGGGREVLVGKKGIGVGEEVGDGLGLALCQQGVGCVIVVEVVVE